MSTLELWSYISGCHASSLFWLLQPYSGSVVGLPSSIRLCRTRAPQPSLRRTEILAAEMINVTTAFIVWTSQQPDTGITGYQVSSETT